MDELEDHGNDDWSQQSDMHNQNRQVEDFTGHLGKPVDNFMMDGLSPAVPLTTTHGKQKVSKFKKLMINAPSDFMSFSTFYNRENT